MTGVRKRSRVAKLRKSVKAISPTIAVLLMIAIAVIAAIVVYLWIMGFLNFNTAKAGRAIQIQSVMYTGTHLVVYVQNVGQGAVTFTPNQCLYVDGLLRNKASVNPTNLEQTKTTSIVDNVTLSLNQKVKLKVVTNEGTWIEQDFTVYTFTGDYTLSVLVVGNGHVDLVPSGQAYYHETVQLTAVADPYWTFGDPLWSGSLSGNANPEQILMDGNKAVTVTFVPITHQITFSQTGVGSDFVGNLVTIDGTGYTVTDLPQTFTWNEASDHSFSFASPLAVDAGKQYVWVSATGLSTAQSGTVTVPAGPGSVTANYGTQYFLTVDNGGQGTAGGQGWYDVGSSATFSISPTVVPGGTGTQYNFTSWAGSGTGSYAGTDASYSVTMNNPITETAQWKTQYYVVFSADPSDNGTTTPSGAGWYDAGNLTISATAIDPTCRFSFWSATGSITFVDSASASTTAMIVGPGTITANFALNAVDITITSNPASDQNSPYFIKVDNVQVTTPYTISWTIGSDHTLEALSPVFGATDTQYIFTSWSDGGNQTDTYTVPSSSETVTANFDTQYYLTVSSPYGTPSGQGWYGSGTSAYATLNTGTVDDGSGTLRVFTGWSQDAAGSNYAQSDPIVMSSPKTAVADWKTQYVITPSAGPNGLIDPANPVMLDAGGSQTFNFNPSIGYHVSAVLVDGIPVALADQYTFTDVQAPHTIHADFAINTYTIYSLATSGGGSISPPGNIPVTYGADQSFIITPDTGYHIDTLLIDDNFIVPVSPYTFYSVTANHRIWVNFTLNTYTITASAGTGGTINPSGSVTVNYGGDQAFTITADTGYHIADVAVDDVSQGAISPYTFTNVQADHTISATFTLAAASKLAYTAGTSQSLTVSQISSVITVQRQDSSGSPVTSGGTITVNLATNATSSGRFYSDAGGTTRITSVQILNGNSSASFYYNDTTAGTPTLTASSGSLTQATTTFTINSYKLVFSVGQGQILSTGQISGPIRVQRRYPNGNSYSPSQSIWVQLNSTSLSGKFYSNSDGTGQITQIQIGGGNSSSWYFYYMDTSVGTPTLTASSSEYTPATTVFTIQLPTPDIASSFTPHSGIQPGNQVTDTAKLVNATADASGSFTYKLYSGIYPSGTLIDSDTKTVTNGVVPDSKAFTVSTQGPYYFIDEYGGDSKNNGITTYSPESFVAWPSAQTVLLRPNADTSDNHLGTHGASTHYQCVNEVSPDGDTTYVYAQQTSYWTDDTYQLPNLAFTTGTINYVTIHAVARTTGYGSTQLSLTTHGYEYDGSSNPGYPFPLTSGWLEYTAVWPRNPSTNTTWTIQEINDLLVGCSLYENTGDARCTQVYVEVYYTPSSLDHFDFDTIASPQTAGTAFSITVRAKDQYDALFTGYTGTATLTYSAGTINPASISITNGVGTTSVTVTTTGINVYINATGGGKTGTSNTFNVVAPTSPPAIDGFASTNTVSSNTMTITLTTGHANDVLYLSFVGSSGRTISSISSSGTSTWTRRAQITENNDGSHYLETWFATRSTAGTTTINITLGGSGSNCAAVVFGISGANTTNAASIFDGAARTNRGSGTTASVSVTTANANELVIGALGAETTGLPTVGSGFTLIRSQTASTSRLTSDEYRVVSTPQTLSASYIINNVDWGMIAEAIKPA